MKKIFIISILSVTIIVQLKAQDTTIVNKGRVERMNTKLEKRERINALMKLEEEGDPAFKKQNVFGAKLNSDGYGLSFEKGIYKTPKKTLLFQLELNEKKHNKEQKQVVSADVFTGQSNSIIVGKQNNFYQFKLGIGQQYLIGGKANKSGVAVSAIYAGGISIGLAKPYYINVGEKMTSQIKQVTWQEFQENTIKYEAIPFGSSGFAAGWNKVKVKPGLHAKGAMRFDYGRFNEMVSALEAGLNVEYYISSINQMLYNKPKNFFFNAYISILFGKRK